MIYTGSYSFCQGMRLFSILFYVILKKQVERMWALVRDNGQRKLTYSPQNHCTLHGVRWLNKRYLL